MIKVEGLTKYYGERAAIRDLSFNIDKGNTQHESVFVLLNAAATDSAFDIPVSFPNGTRLVDLLNPADEFHVENGRLRVEKVHSCWARILQFSY